MPDSLNNRAPARRVAYISSVRRLPMLTDDEQRVPERVAEKFVFRTNDYYNSLIDWDDPADPLRALVVPHEDELADWGQLDASDEASYQPVPGVEHKYRDTALLLCNDTCAAYCRFCFRKRLFQAGNDEVAKDVSPGIAYIRERPEINNVLLTGGDPLVLSTPRLDAILAPLAAIEHVRNIRIGTKILAFNPFRVLDDPSLVALIDRVGAAKQIYVMAHFNHAAELTPQALRAARALTRASVTIVNQTPIVRGVNDDVSALRDLFNRLSFAGIQSYYVFACRPTLGNKPFVVPIETAYALFEAARAANSGLAKTARFVMSHRIGKIEVIGLTERAILMKYHNAVDAGLNGKLIVFRRDPAACWFDDYLGRETELW